MKKGCKRRAFELKQTSFIVSITSALWNHMVLFDWLMDCKSHVAVMLHLKTLPAAIPPSAVYRVFPVLDRICCSVFWVILWFCPSSGVRNINSGWWKDEHERFSCSGWPKPLTVAGSLPGKRINVRWVLISLMDLESLYHSPTSSGTDVGGESTTICFPCHTWSDCE